MPADVHALVQNAVDVNAVAVHTIEDCVATNPVFPISLADVITSAPSVKSLGDVDKGFVYYSEVVLILVLTPGLHRVVPDGFQIGKGLWA